MGADNTKKKEGVFINFDLKLLFPFCFLFLPFNLMA